MCEIFAMSSRHPTAVTLSMGALARHGRPGGHLDDGWGVAFHDGADASLLREPGAAGDSPLLRLLADRPPRAALVLAHIRHATQGTRGLRNTQPFARELGGRMHVFAHNGNLLGQPPARGRFRPVGETNLAAMVVDDLLHDGQPKPGALGLGGYVRLEGAGQDLRLEAGAVVADR